MFCSVKSAAICGIESRIITVEADIGDGLPMFSMVGVLASEVKEAQDRVRTALKNSGIALPPKRITVNLAPADVRKAGSGFDLPIAVAVLAAQGYIPQEELDGVLIVGELSLNGRINGITGVMAMIASAKAAGFHTCIVPYENMQEGAYLEGIRVLGAESISQVLEHFTASSELPETLINIEGFAKEQENWKVDFSEIQGQRMVKRAAQIAVSGRHNLLIIGPPGAGKSLTAKRIPTILPEITLEEALEISRIHSVAGELSKTNQLITHPPFRAPHHTITPAALAGGGNPPKPGEVSLSHRGILYLDELPEFRSTTLEILRQPLEDHYVNISRNSGNYQFPADFMLVASMNPCKCGYYPDRNRCTCSVRDVRKYLNHISRPLLDRIDLCVEAQPVSFQELSIKSEEETSAVIRERVRRVHQIQRERYRKEGILFNGELSMEGIHKYCCLSKENEEMMERAYEKFQLTARSYGKILKVARTIADLDESEEIQGKHLGEAICYRSLDQKYWGKMVE